MLRQAILTSDLLPSAYAHYRPLLADGLIFFLRQLSSDRLAPIFSEQAQLFTASVESRLVALLHHVPSLHKLGQVVARDGRLHSDFRAHLQQLETFEPRLPFHNFAAFLDSQIKGWRKAGIQLASKPLAEGSVAVIVPFSWRAGRHAPRQGVFKVLKPGIKKLLGEELAIWSKLGAFLDDCCHKYHLPSLDYRETFELVTELLRHEVCLDQEQRHLATAAKAYASNASIVIPELLPFCTPRLTAMEYLEGAPLTSCLANGDFSVRQLAPTIAEALVAMPLFARAQNACFHGDPHAGNLFRTKDGRLGILDWSLVGRLDKHARIQLVQLVISGLMQDVPRMLQAIDELSVTPPDPSLLAVVINEQLQSLRWGKAPGATWLIQLLDQVVLRAKGRLSGNLLLFRKSLLTLEGVLRDLCGQEASLACLDAALAQYFSRQLLLDWPQRFFRWPNSRVSSTHLSNQDVFSLFWTAPLSCARCLSGAWRDITAPLPGQK